MEVVFESGTVVYVADVLETPGFIQIDPSPQKFFKLENERLQSAYLFWEDNKHLLRQIRPTYVCGLRGTASTMDLLRIVCTLLLKDPQDQMIPFSFWAGGHEDNLPSDREAENGILPHTIEADYHCGESGCSIEWDWWTLGYLRTVCKTFHRCEISRPPEHMLKNYHFG